MDSPVRIRGLEGCTEEEVCKYVRERFEAMLEGTDIDAEIVGIKVIGSRVNGDSDENSDLDVLLEFRGDASEDGLFNILNDDEEGRLFIGGVPVDINPITASKSGSIAEFLERNREYRKEINKRENIINEDNNMEQKIIIEETVNDDDVSVGMLGQPEEGMAEEASVLERRILEGYRREDLVDVPMFLLKPVFYTYNDNEGQEITEELTAYTVDEGLIMLYGGMDAAGKHLSPTMLSDLPAADRLAVGKSILANLWDSVYREMEQDTAVFSRRSIGTGGLDAEEFRLQQLLFQTFGMDDFELNFSIPLKLEDENGRTYEVGGIRQTEIYGQTVYVVKVDRDKEMPLHNFGYYDGLHRRVLAELIRDAVQLSGEPAAKALLDHDVLDAVNVAPEDSSVKDVMEGVSVSGDGMLQVRFAGDEHCLAGRVVSGQDLVKELDVPFLTALLDTTRKLADIARDAVREQREQQGQAVKKDIADALPEPASRLYRITYGTFPGLNGIYGDIHVDFGKNIDAVGFKEMQRIAEETGGKARVTEGHDWADFHRESDALLYAERISALNNARMMGGQVPVGSVFSERDMAADGGRKLTDVCISRSGSDGRTYLSCRIDGERQMRKGLREEDARKVAAGKVKAEDLAQKYYREELGNNRERKNGLRR